MRSIAIAIGLVATPALAQPGPPASADEAAPCQATVTLRRAPDDVRAVIDTWVHREPSCSQALDVSVDPVDDGYVVNARDSAGRVRVRIVPDAETIAVLIASWSADDRVDPALGPQAPPAMATDPLRDPAVGRAPDAPRARRLLLAAVAGEAAGVRGDVDLLGRWILVGIAASATWHLGDEQMINTVTRGQRKLQALAYVGVAYTAPRWQLRLQVGAGAQQTQGTIVSYGADLGYAVVDPILDASVTASRELGAGWWLTAGVVVTEPLSETWPYSDGAQYNVSRLNRPVPAAQLGLSWAL